MKIPVKKKMRTPAEKWLFIINIHDDSAEFSKQVRLKNSQIEFYPQDFVDEILKGC